MLIGGMDEPTAARVRSNVQIISEGYVHFNDGDIEWMCERLSPGIVWDDSKNVPGTKTYQGIEEVRAYLESFSRVWERPRFVPERFTGRGDRVLVEVSFRARGAQSGAEVDAELSHLYEMRNGHAVRVTTYLNRRRAEQDFEDAAGRGSRPPRTRPAPSPSSAG
jgi:ketosteroid isomerase-like protein